MAKQHIARTQTEAARFFSISRQGFRRWLDQGAPGNPEGPFDLSAVASWLVKRKTLVVDGEGAIEAELLSGSTSPALERWRTARAAAAELDLARKQQALVDVEMVAKCFAEAARMIRMAGERLHRTFGLEAQRILDEYLDEAERAVDEILKNEEQK